MLYEITRPGEDRPFIMCNNPSGSMLSWIRHTYPDYQIISKWTCEICYLPDYRDYTNVCGKWRSCLNCGHVTEVMK